MYIHIIDLLDKLTGEIIMFSMFDLLDKLTGEIIMFSMFSNITITVLTFVCHCIKQKDNNCRQKWLVLSPSHQIMHSQDKQVS